MELQITTNLLIAVYRLSLGICYHSAEQEIALFYGTEVSFPFSRVLETGFYPELVLFSPHFYARIFYNSFLY
jgi:hypothetical protein